MNTKYLDVHIFADKKDKVSMENLEKIKEWAIQSMLTNMSLGDIAIMANMTKGFYGDVLEKYRKDPCKTELPNLFKGGILEVYQQDDFLFIATEVHEDADGEFWDLLLESPEMKMSIDNSSGLSVSVEDCNFDEDSDLEDCCDFE